MKIVCIAMLLFSASTALAEQKQKVIIKYKQYEKFDLGDMEVKGSIIAPGDLSVQERRRKVFERKLINKTNFDELIIEDTKFLR